MEITIKIDYGQGYLVSLTPTEARKLYDQLKVIFEPIFNPYYHTFTTPHWVVTSDGTTDFIDHASVQKSLTSDIKALEDKTHPQSLPERCAKGLDCSCELCNRSHI